MRYVIFDLDGVLVDSEPYWQEAFASVANQWCVEHGFATAELSPSDMAKYQGGRVDETMLSVLGALGHGPTAEAEIDDITERVIARSSALFDASPAPITASVEVVKELSAQGAVLAVASSSASQFIERALQTLEISQYFTVAQSALPLTLGKPHPDVYLLALDALGAREGEALAVEDSLTGLAAALRAGLECIWLLRGRQISDEAAIDELRDYLAGLDVPRDLSRGVVRISRSLSLADFLMGSD